MKSDQNKDQLLSLFPRTTILPYWPFWSTWNSVSSTVFKMYLLQMQSFHLSTTLMTQTKIESCLHREFHNDSSLPNARYSSIDSSLMLSYSHFYSRRHTNSPKAVWKRISDVASWRTNNFRGHPQKSLCINAKLNMVLVNQVYLSK